MHIRHLQYARVPQIGLLNHNFRPERKHLVVTLDVDGYTCPPHNDFLTIYGSLAALFPTLSKHSCCEQWENTPLYLQETQGVSVKWVGEVADVAHLVEHVAVDLQCAISDMRKCSGITCGHNDPENRFDLFLECDDPTVGAFSVHLATYLVEAMFTKPRLSKRYRDIVNAARLVISDPDNLPDGCALAEQLAISPARGRWALAALTAFGLVREEGSDGNGDDS